MDMVNANKAKYEVWYSISAQWQLIDQMQLRRRLAVNDCRVAHKKKQKL